MKKLILIYYILFAAGLSYAQSLTPTENYVYTRTYLEPVTSENPSARQMQSVQYFDGLGRPKQGVSIQSTVTGKDLVVPIEYDSSGRQTKSYLPVPVSSLNGALQNTDGNAANAYYGTANAYSETLVEKSPLGRVLKQAHPGEDWAMTTDHTLKYEYETNAAGEVKKFKVTTTWNAANLIDDVSIEFAPDDNFTAANYYKANTLDKKISKNEDNRETQIFTNSSGQTILIRRVNKTDAGIPQYTDTYYGYDDYGNLSFVIPPKAAAFNTIEELKAQMDDLCYQYRYDKFNRTVEKKIPGKGWEFLVYDQQNRLVGSQDAEMRKKGQWMYTKYDQLGRVAFTGIFSGTTRASQQVWADSFGANNVKRTANVFFNREGMDVFYDPNGTYPTTDWVKLLSVNYYDTYPAGSPPVPDKILEQATLSAVPSTITSNGYTTVRSIRSLPTASHTKNVEDDNWTSSFIWYDRQGSAVGTYGKNHLGGTTRTETELDFSGVVQRSIVYHKRLDTDAETVIRQRSVYDRNNVLQKQYHQVNSQPEELLAENTYNDIGQMISKKVGQHLQTIDYRYNIRGWLTKINDPANLNGKLFGYEVKYSHPVYTTIAPGNFDGTVSEVDWKTADNNVQKRYTYGYDALNRLKDAIYTEPGSTTPYNNNYNENVTYDLNGNIATLKRNAFPVMGTTSTQVDNLVYQYTGNRLDKVIENSLNDTGYEGGNNTIDYDLNGNMINMKDKGIQTIQYNILDLPNAYDIVQTTLGSTVRSTLGYLYRADGTKLRKTMTSKRDGRGTSMTTRMTDYLDGFQYSYTDRGGLEPCLTCKTERAFEEQAYKNINDFAGFDSLPEWKLDMIPTAEGFYSFAENRYIYQYEDHLGNARVSFAKNSTGVPEILDVNNYYPFGLNHIGGNGLNSSGFGSWQSYKYNGKELQETGMYDYGARFYMADLGRWGVIDPLAEQSRRWSPYHYAADNPVNFIDPDGRIALKVNNADQVIGGVDENYLATSQWNSDRGRTNLGAPVKQGRVYTTDEGIVYEGDKVREGLSSLMNPKFQFPKGEEEYYKKSYPAFYNLVTTILPKMTQNKDFMEALSIASGFSPDELSDIFQYGKGAIFHADKLAYGDAQYDFAETKDKMDINKISIEKNVLNWYEKANLDTTSLEGVTNIFWMVMLAGHETSHWGDHTKRIKRFIDTPIAQEFNNEVGVFFEFRAMKSTFPNTQVKTSLYMGNYGSKISDIFKVFVEKNFKTLSNIISK